MFAEVRPLRKRIDLCKPKFNENRIKDFQLRDRGHGRTGVDHFAGNSVGRGGEAGAGCQNLGIARIVPARRVGGSAHQIRRKSFFAAGGSQKSRFDRGFGNAGVFEGGLFCQFADAIPGR